MDKGELQLLQSESDCRPHRLRVSLSLFKTLPPGDHEGVYTAKKKVYVECTHEYTWAQEEAVAGDVEYALHIMGIAGETLRTQKNIHRLQNQHIHLSLYDSSVR